MVSSEEAFHVIMDDFWLVRGVGCCTCICIFSIMGVGCLYFVIASLHLSASIKMFR